ncbi:MAG: hypothetical protein ABEJ43_08170, partial [Haloferacaceae archaeon]
MALFVPTERIAPFSFVRIVRASIALNFVRSCERLLAGRSTFEEPLMLERRPSHRGEQLCCAKIHYLESLGRIS